MKNKLKLFIWNDFSRSYSSGLAFAIAKDETEAKKLVIKEEGYNVDDWGDVEIKSLSRKIARSVSGGD